jgi:hypothetical protein
MERLYWTVVQLEEAKRLVKQGDVAHLRLALILLDNAVEVMMHRVIEGKLRHANMYARMLENFPKGPLDPEGEKIRRDLSLQIVPIKQQKQIRRIFGEKILFLSKDHDSIPGPSARALRHLHDYRNETQHQDQVRSESIRPAVLILFDIATDFLVRLQPGTTSWVGGENYDWLKRYGIRNPRRIHMSEEIRPRIAKKLRSGLPLDAEGIRTALIAHLTDRLDAMENQLDFVSENTKGQDRAQTLRSIQSWQLPEQQVSASHDLESFKRWRAAVEGLNAVGDKMEMFDQFAAIEDDFEPVEMMIDDAVSKIDAQIQLAVDEMRGK